MAAKTKSKVNPKYKTKYRVQNWAAYEKSLRCRGDLTVWFDEGAIGAWNATSSGLPGGQRRYSDLAILTALTLRTVYHLALRQTEGFVASLIGLMGLELETPDHTTLSRRSGTLEVPKFVGRHDGPIHLVIDSTGLKIVGDGEWHAYKHRSSNKRRSWRKLHLAVRDGGFIEASVLTDSRADDSTVGEDLLEKLVVPVASFRGDGAYDSRAFYAALGRAGTPDIDIVIPPRRKASPSRPVEGTWQQRNEAIDRIEQVGRRQWRKESGAHQQARAENGMFRYKRIVGDHLRARTFERQKREAMIGVNIVNRMTVLGMPESQAIRA